MVSDRNGVANRLCGFRVGLEEEGPGPVQRGLNLLKRLGGSRGALRFGFVRLSVKNQTGA